MPIVTQLPNQVEAVLVRHTQVADQHVGALLGKRLKRRGGAARCDDDGADSFQHHHQYAAGIVIYEHVHAIKTNGRAAVGDVDGIPGFLLATVGCDLHPHRAVGRRTAERAPSH